MPRVFVGIGSNIEKERLLPSGIRQLHAYYHPLTVSTIYESPAIGFTGDSFYNVVAAFDTEDPLDRVLANLKNIENSHGRKRGHARFSPRTLDLDLLLYGDLVTRESALPIPHPDITQYAFVLRPLAEIAPDRRHPETGMTFKAMWRRFNQDNQLLSPVRINL